jgi:hypothetical protein
VDFDFSNKNLYEDRYFSGFLGFSRQIFPTGDKILLSNVLIIINTLYTLYIFYNEVENL